LDARWYHFRTAPLNNSIASAAALSACRENAPMARVDDHAISFMLAIGKQTKPAWPRGDRLPDSEVVIADRFPG
jgi:hypothetical protein